jgi:GTP 3',8-cyclase
MAPFDSGIAGAPGLADRFGRTVTYLRVSVTDRCDLRCVYCMAERMQFLPRAEVLSIEELDRLVSAFVSLGVRKVRLTGGEPLVRKGFIELVGRLSRHLESRGLDELTVTTNGSRLAEHAAELVRLGVRRVNISLDTLKPELFARLTRGGELSRVLAGIDAAQAAGLAVKINTVALKNDNVGELPQLIAWAHGRGMDATLIETMPLGEVGADRMDQHLSLAKVRTELSSFWTLTDLPLTTGGPARYVRVEETGGRIGFITPLSHNFCAACNRVRLTCTGVLHGCLGQDHAADLRSVLRSGAGEAELVGAIRAAIAAKPEGHDFQIRPGAPAIARHMSTTGG